MTVVGALVVEGAAVVVAIVGDGVAVVRVAISIIRFHR